MAIMYFPDLNGTGGLVDRNNPRAGPKSVIDPARVLY